MSLLNIKQVHRLSTHEDSKFFHFHKILGIACMSHFIYRIYLGCKYGSLGFNPSITTLAWIGVHALLHVSSFQFILPNRRNKVYNIIWPEMRWHSLIFAYRALIGMLLLLAYESHLISSKLILFGTRCALVILTMVCADAITKYYKVIDSTTMRNNPYPESTPQWLIKSLNTFYSISQLYATLNILLNDKATMFLTLIPIQTAPFGMTLVKKGIINQTSWHISYIVALLLNFAYGIVKVETIKAHVNSMVMFIVVFRFALNQNKYLLWMMVMVYIYYAKEYM